MSNYGPKAQKQIGKTMHEFKQGDLRSGRSRKKVTSRKQAVAIGLSKARDKNTRRQRRLKESLSA